MMRNPLEGFLQSGETILWEGKPNKARYLRQGWWAIPFSLFWCGFAIFWEASAASSHAPFFFLLFGFAFVLIGLYLVFGRFFVAIREAENAWYAVTNRRVLIQRGAFQTDFTELDLAKIPLVHLSQRWAEGIGTITFGPTLPTQRYMVIPGWPGMAGYQAPSLQCIERARDVYDIIKQAQG